ncbi:hypothetical protein EDD85DRAFT_794742 [Armillaria nabsnona]|nr:hypothetical protein EDD85DRAFT_794742 [Armillaria nabsnona]
MSTAVRDIRARAIPNWFEYTDFDDRPDMELWEDWMWEVSTLYRKMGSYDTELAAYQLLHRLQGRVFCTPESTPLHPITNIVQGLVLEYIPGTGMEKLKPGIDVWPRGFPVTNVVLWEGIALPSSSTLEMLGTSGEQTFGYILISPVQVYLDDLSPFRYSRVDVALARWHRGYTATSVDSSSVFGRISEEMMGLEAARCGDQALLEERRTDVDYLGVEKNINRWINFHHDGDLEQRVRQVHGVRIEESKCR